LNRPGAYVIVYRSHRSSVTLEPEKFEKYLSEEGLDRTLQERRGRAEREKPGREVYSRCAKALLAAGRLTEDAIWGRPVGLTLELLPEGDLLRAGETIRFRLLYDGKPLSGALVKAIAREDPETTLSARTEANGRAALRLGRKGVWLVKAVHMVAAPPETGADWESFWASLTFELP
jgi:uncharacterized GH25 family protein